MATLQAFTPAYGQGQAVSVTTTPTLIGIDEYAPNVRVANYNDITVFVRVTGVNQENSTAVVAEDFAVGPNESRIIGKGNGQGQMSLVAASGSGTVYVQPGVGVWA